MDEPVINESNFSQYFFDVRRNKPKPGQVLAKFCAIAIFGNGPEKMDLIKVLKMGKAKQAAEVMKKIHCAKEPDCYRVCREMSEDLASGMTDEQVATKDYEFMLEVFYYTQREYVPRDDTHWECLALVQYDPDTKTYKSDIHL